jgi:hypothetical protein
MSSGCSIVGTRGSFCGKLKGGVRSKGGKKLTPSCWKTDAGVDRCMAGVSTLTSDVSRARAVVLGGWS